MATQTKPQTALVIGASHPAVEAMSTSLARRGWRVVLIDQNAARLRATAQNDPGRIDILAMALDSRSNAERLGEVWGREPVHLLAQFQPLVLPRQITLAVRSVDLMARSFAAGLAAAGGLNLVALPRARDLADPLAQAGEGAHGHAFRALARRDGALGFRTVGVKFQQRRAAHLAEAVVALATGQTAAAHGTVRVV